MHILSTIDDKIILFKLQIICLYTSKEQRCVCILHLVTRNFMLYIQYATYIPRDVRIYGPRS